MAVALFGELVIDPGADDAPDAYALFYGRSAAMGWLTPASRHPTIGFWGMNDAGAHPSSSGSPGVPVAWFQVVRTNPAPDAVVPQAFLACVADVMARLGSLQLDAVQVLLPAQSVGEGIIVSRSGLRMSGSLVEATGWFHSCRAVARQPVRATVDSGPDPAIELRGGLLERWVREVRVSDVFRCDPVSRPAPEHLDLGEMFFDAPGATVEHHYATLRGTLAEWSLGAVGWLSAFLADGCSRNGITGPLRLTIGRPGCTSSTLR